MQLELGSATFQVALVGVPRPTHERSLLSANGAVQPQPRAPPWETGATNQPSPERAIQTMPQSRGVPDRITFW